MAADKNSTQSDKFKQAAHEIGSDEDETRWDQRLKKIAKVKPKLEKGD